MRKTKVALKEFGLISFDHDFWGRHQPFNPETLLKDITDVCLQRGIGICAITSEYWEIPRGSPHDRFGLLEGQMSSLHHPYTASKPGENTIRIERKDDEGIVYLVNGQSVIVKETVNGKNRRLGHLVIGSNQVPNLMSLEETVKYCKDNGLIQIAEDPLSVIDSYWGGSGMNETELLKYLEDCDAIQGHNAHFMIPEFLSWGLPKLSPRFDKLKKISRGLNRKAQEFAHRHNKPYVAVTGSHRLQDMGRACIEIGISDVFWHSEEALLESLKDIIREGHFTNVKGYISFLGLREYKNQFLAGLEDPKYHEHNPEDREYEHLFE